MEDQVLVLGNKNKIFRIDLITHSKVYEYSLVNNSDIHSILCLDKNQFIVCQRNYISHFYLDKKHNFFNFKGSLYLDSAVLYKYPKNRLLIKPPVINTKTLYL